MDRLSRVYRLGYDSPSLRHFREDDTEEIGITHRDVVASLQKIVQLKENGTREHLEHVIEDARERFAALLKTQDIDGNLPGEVAQLKAEIEEFDSTKPEFDS